MRCTKWPASVSMAFVRKFSFSFLHSSPHEILSYSKKDPLPSFHPINNITGIPYFSNVFRNY